MDPNSTNPVETVNRDVSTIAWLREWLRLEGGNNRSAQVLAVLAEQTERCLARGEQPPVGEMEALREAVLDREGGQKSEEQPLAKWLPRKQLQTWWDSREARRTNQASAAGLTHRPKLIAQEGGGRGNVNRFCFELEPIPSSPNALEESDASGASGPPNQMTYSGRPMRASVLFRWLLPGRPVLLRSWRGLALAGWLIASGLLVVLVWGLAFLILRHAGPLTGIDLFIVLFAILVTGSTYLADKPWLSLPEERLAIAPDIVLRWDEPYGQLQLIRDRAGKRSGWLTLMRYSGTCPICAATVELTEGRRDFPGRIIGRCRDAPLEHVFSFDPVSLTGTPLRQS
jgi:hypothetical protein